MRTWARGGGNEAKRFVGSFTGQENYVSLSFSKPGLASLLKGARLLHYARSEYLSCVHSTCATLHRFFAISLAMCNVIIAAVVVVVVAATAF